MRKGFTLIELMISIVILSIMMVFLYKSYAELNAQNRLYDQESVKIKKIENLKEVFFLDLSLKEVKTAVTIVPQEKTQDIVFFQSHHSVHNRINPYVGYIIKEQKLYRIESLKELKTYPLDLGIDFDVDYLGEIEVFRVYPAQNEHFLVHIKFKELGEILIKIKSFS